MASNPGSKTGRFTAQVQRCCEPGCDKPGTVRHQAAPPDQRDNRWYCEDHYEERFGDRNSAEGPRSW